MRSANNKRLSSIVNINNHANTNFKTMQNIENLPILDKETAISELDNAELFEEMLFSFEDMSMYENLNDLKVAIENSDLRNIRLTSHSLKGASSYIHAERVKSAAANMQEAIDKGKPEEVEKYYPELVRQCILLKREIRKELCDKEKKPFNEDYTDFDVPLATGYSVVKIPGDFKVARVEALHKITETDSEEFAEKEERGNIKTNEEAKSTCCTCNLL